MTYVMVLQVPFYKVSEEVIACESAFSMHLKQLLPRVQQWGDKIVICSPLMSESEYTKNKHHLAHIQCQKENIFYIESAPADISRRGFLLRAMFTVWPKIWKIVRSATVVHSSVSKDIYRPFTFIALLFSVIQRKKSVCVMDIDHRNSAKMAYQTGQYSYKSYLMAQYIYNPLISLQLRFVSKFCNLILLKGQTLVDDYGKGRDKVKNFYDTAHDQSFVLTGQELKKKLATWDGGKQTIKLIYFGRLVEYKGIKDMVLATGKAAAMLKEEHRGQTVSLTIAGSGILKAEIQDLVRQQNLDDIVQFCDALHYGDELFSYLKNHDFLLAAPHTEDTPRNVFDAMACGLPMIAYDTYYYKDLQHTGTVKTVPWLSVDALAEKILALSQDVATVKNMIVAGREFAICNTQTAWLDKRLSWSQQYLT